MPTIEEYLKNGLTFLSNNTSIHPRDGAGNIILKSYDPADSSSFVENPKLYIENNNYNYLVSSVNKVIDTRFSFFQFPVEVAGSDDTPDLDFPDFDFSNDPFKFDNDIISGKFKILASVDANGQSSIYKRINTSYNNGNWDGQPWFNPDNQGGYRRLPFDTGEHQEPSHPGSYLITQDKINYLREKNKTIRFRFYVQFRSIGFDKNVSTTFALQLVRNEMDPGWTGGMHHRRRLPRLKTEDRGEQFPENGYPVLYMEYILHPSDMYDLYRYELQACAGYPSWVLGDSCLWVVDMVDIPTAAQKPLWGNNDGFGNNGTYNYGVYNISNNTMLLNGNDDIIGIKMDNKYDPCGQLLNSVNTTQANIDALQQTLTLKYVSETSKMNAEINTQNQKIISAEVRLNYLRKTLDTINSPLFNLAAFLLSAGLGLVAITSKKQLKSALNKEIKEKLTMIANAITEKANIQVKYASLTNSAAELNEIADLEKQLQNIETEFLKSPTEEEKKQLALLQQKTQDRLNELKKKYNL